MVEFGVAGLPFFKSNGAGDVWLKGGKMQGWII